MIFNATYKNADHQQMYKESFFINLTRSYMFGRWWVIVWVWFFVLVTICVN
jgi:hypothetical protein